MVTVRASIPWLIGLALTSAAVSAAPAASAPPASLVFERASGQEGAYIARSGNFSVMLDSKHAAFRLSGKQGNPIALEMQLVGARKVTPQGEGIEDGTVNYLVGPASTWRRGVASYSKIRYSEMYRGVDLVYHGRGRKLEYDFVVAPGGDASAIVMQWRGAQSLRIDQGGNLIISSEGDKVAWEAPVIYQNAGGSRLSVPGGFHLLGGNRVGFSLGQYDRSLPVVIDPTLAVTTFVGGRRNVPATPPYAEQTASRGTAVDPGGNVYITGVSKSMSLPVTAGAYQTGYAGNTTAQVSGDAFVAKYNSSGTLLYLTYLGGRFDDVGLAIAVDSAGSAYVTGYTNSSDFPVTSGALQTRYAGNSGTAYFLIEGDAFVTKLSPDGKSLIYSTYLGGPADDAGFGIALDGSGNAYITGSTQSTSFPVTPGAAQTRYAGAGGQSSFPFYGQAILSSGDAFISKLNPTGTALLYSTFLGGSNDDTGTSIAVDSAGAAYVGGATLSRNFPVTAGAFQSGYGGAGINANFFFNLGDGFVAKLNPSGSSFGYVSFVGARGDDAVTAVTVDATGALYGTGTSTSDNFPTTPGALQDSLRGPQSIPVNVEVVYGDAVIFKVNPAGSALVFSTYYGGNGDDAGMGIALDSGGNVLVAGFSSSNDLAVTQDAVQKTLGAPAYQEIGHNDRTFGNGFLIQLSPNGARRYATYLGGSEDTGLFSIAVTPSGTAWASGAATVRTDAFLVSLTGMTSGVPAIFSVGSNTGGASIAENTWIEIKGQNLAATRRIWQGSDFVNGQMPTQLDGVSVRVNGRAAFVYFISPEQVNVLTPLDPGLGPVLIQLTNASGTSASVTASKQTTAPGFFQFNGGPYVAATHANGALIGPASLFPGSSTPVKPGEVIVLYGNGFGSTSPAIVAGSATQSGVLPTNPVVRIGGSSADVQFAGVISPGLYQFNVVVPDVANGDQPLAATYNGQSTQSGALVTVQR